MAAKRSDGHRAHQATGQHESQPSPDDGTALSSTTEPDRRSAMAQKAQDAGDADSELDKLHRQAGEALEK